MATIADLLVKISADTSQFRKEIEASQRQLKRAYGSEALTASKRFLQSLVAIGAGFTAVGAASVKMAGDMRVVERSFANLIGDAEKAKATLQDLKEFTTRTPFGFNDITDASKKLLAYGFQAKDLIPVLQAAGDASAMMGNGTEGVDRITLALGQMLMKGKVVTEEMKQLINADVKAWQYLADEMGISIEEAQEMARKGQISAAQGITAIVNGMQKDFKGGMDAIAQELPGQWSAIKSNVQLALIEIGTSLTETFNIKDKMQAAVDWTGRFAQSLQDGGIKAAFFANTSAKAQVAIFAIAGAITAAAIPALVKLALTAAVAQIPLLPLIVIGAAIGAVALLIYKNWDKLGNYFSTRFTTAINVVKIAIDGIRTVFLKIIKTAYTAKGAILGIFSSKKAEEYRTKINEINGELQEISNRQQQHIGEIKQAWDGASAALDAYKGKLAELLGIGIGGAVAGGAAISPAALQLNGWQGITGGAGGGSDANKSASKAAKALADGVKDALDAVKQLSANWRELNTEIARGALTGEALFKFDQQNELATAIDKLKTDFDDITDRFNNSTEKQKEIYRKWLDEMGIMYAETQNGMLDLTAARLEKEDALRANQKEKERRDEAANLAILAELDAARYEGDMARLIEYLDAEKAQRLAHLEGVQALQDLFVETRKAAMMDEYMFMNEVYGQFYTGFSETLSNIITQTQSASEAFKALGKSMLKAIADFITKKIAAMITSTMMAITLGKKQSAASIGDAAAMAAAWAKPAMLVAIATQGAAVAAAAISVPAALTLAQSISVVPMAKGGIVTGPTPALIGEGRYNEAVLPLNQNYLERVGLVQNNPPVVNAVQNNYGDINTDVDWDELQAKFGLMLQSTFKVA